MFSEKKQQVVINREKLCKEIILFGDTKSSWKNSPLLMSWFTFWQGYCGKNYNFKWF